MGTVFSAGGRDLYLSDGATGVFFDVLTLAGSAIAGTAWERRLVLHLAPVPEPAPAWGDWRMPPEPARVALCDIHGVFAGDYGCRFCTPGVA